MCVLSASLNLIANPTTESLAVVDTIKTVSDGDWSDPTTWSNNQLPSISDNVKIPNGFKVVLDTDTEVRTLLINGTLTADTSQDLSLSAGWILVAGPESEFIWGTEAKPYDKKGVITLRGVGSNHMSMGDKFLAGMDSTTIELHGKSKKSWTKINQTANRGDLDIVLLEAVDWEVGDEIVIASTDFDPHEAEKRMITAISADQKTISLDCPLAYKHWGTLQTFDDDTRILDERAEVGLLTRNLKIQGNEASEDNRFGGHMMIMNTAVVHVSGIQLYRMGQFGVLGRYPFHWHKSLDVSGQYIKNSTIERSFNRAVTVHGTDNAEIIDNVAYDHIGHGFFLEDASEQGNIFDGNLGILSRIPVNANGQPAGIEPHDIVIRAGVHLSPATFWITNNSNTFINNVAAGSEGTGFWYISPERDFFDDNAPRRDYSLFPLKIDSFENNVAHSCLALGVAFNGNMDASKEVDPLNTTRSTPPNPHLKNNTVYKCEGNGLWTLTRAAIYENWIFADNGAATFHVFFQTFRNCLFIGRSDNVGTLDSDEDAALGYNNPDDLIIKKESRFNAFAFYDGPLGLEDCHFDNYPDESSQLLTILGAAVVSSSNYAINTSFGPNVEVKEKLTYLTTARDGRKGTNHEDNVFSTVFNDRDGTFTGSQGSYSIKLAPPNTYYPYDPAFFHEPNAQVKPDWDAYYNATAKFAVIEAKGVVTTQTSSPAVDSDQFVRRHLMNGQSNVTSMENSSVANANHWKFPVIMNQPSGNSSKYTYSFQNVEVARKWKGLRLTHAGYDQANKEYVDVEFVNVPNDVFFERDDANNCVTGIETVYCYLPKEFDSLSDLQSQNDSTGYYQDDNSLHIRFVADDEFKQFGGSYRTAQSTGFNVSFVAQTALDFAIQRVIPLAEFNTGIDSRGLQGTNGNLPLTGIGAHNNGFNFFYVHNDGDAVAEHTDYFLQFKPQVWTPFPTLNIQLATSVQAQVFIRDGSTYHYLGQAGHGQNSFSLSGLSTNLWEVNEVILRYHEADIPNINTPTVVHLEQMTLGTGLGDGDGDGINDQEEKLACRNPNSAADMEFDFDLDTLGWQKVDIAAEDFGTREFWYFRVDNAADPRIVREDLHMNGNDFSKIYIRFQSEHAKLVDLWWGTASNPSIESTARRLSFNYTTPNEWVEAEFDMTGHPQWVNNTITSLRFDPPSDTSKKVHTSIDFIRNENAEKIYITQSSTASCLGDPVEFTAILNNPVGGESFQWQFYKDGNWQDVINGSGANSLIYTTDAAFGNLPYRVRYSSTGCESYSTPVEATLINIPTIEIPETFTGCSSSSSYLSLDANPQGGTFSHPAIVGNPIYINAGGPAVAINGVNWIADNYFQNGTAFAYNPNTNIAGTDSDDLYLTERWFGGTALQYEIPVPDGEYLVLLHFAEAWPTAFNPGIRVFDIEIEGALVDEDYDIYASIGSLTADVRPYRVHVEDGVLNLDLIKGIQNPKLNAISVLPRSLDPAALIVDTHLLEFEYIDEATGCIYNASSELEILAPPSPPFTYQGGSPEMCESASPINLVASPSGGVWTGNGIVGSAIFINCGDAATPTSDGDITWQTDDYFSVASTREYPNGFINYYANEEIFRTERVRTINFRYDISVPAGSYEVLLYFAETWPSNQATGLRTFDIEIEGTTVASDFDIFKEAGGYAALIKSYTVNSSDGFLNIEFVKKNDFPKINAIAILPISYDPSLAGPGTHELIYTYNDPLIGCSSQNNAFIIVNPNPDAIATPSGLESCPGEAIQLIGNTSSSSGSITYEWRIAGDATGFANSQTTSISPMVDTAYELWVSQDGCQSLPTTIHIDVAPYNDNSKTYVGPLAIPDGTHKRVNVQILMDGSIGDVELLGGDKAEFRAGDNITVEPGFTVRPGAELLLTIENCN